MTTFVIYREDAIGDLVDVEYYDSAWCMMDALASDGIFTRHAEGGQRGKDSGQMISFGEAPCAASGVEYAVYCGTCGQPMNEEARVRVQHNTEVDA